jgi:hypothetical protein
MENPEARNASTNGAFLESDGEPSLRAVIDAIADHCSSLPVIDDRSPDEILGYDEHGLPS